MKFKQASQLRAANAVAVIGKGESARGLAHSKSLRTARRAACGEAFGVRQSSGAFTLAEVLAALAFMAIVIPVAVNGLRVANLAGQVGERKAVAARVAERVLNEWTVTGASQTPS